MTSYERREYEEKSGLTADVIRRAHDARVLCVNPKMERYAKAVCREALGDGFGQRLRVVIDTGKSLGKYGWQLSDDRGAIAWRAVTPT